jgi:hypothetical protein
MEKYCFWNTTFENNINYLHCYEDFVTVLIVFKNFCSIQTIKKEKGKEKN